MDPRQRNALAIAVVLVLVAGALWSLLPLQGPDRLERLGTDGGSTAEETRLLTEGRLTFGADGLPALAPVDSQTALELRPAPDGDGPDAWWLVPGEPAAIIIAIEQLPEGGSRETTAAVTAERELGYGERFMVGEQPYIVRHGATSINQGLDIQGGLSVILTAQETPETEVTDSVMDRAELIVRNRVDRLGASEVSIQRQGADSIMVQLPGIANAQEALDALGSTGQLEISDVIGIDESGEVILGDVLLTGDVITAASIGTNPTNNEIEVNVTFNAEGSRAWAEITGARIGRQIAIVLDGNVESAPVVRDRISGGETSISGDFTPEEARRLRTVLETGALPVALDFSESRVVGPTLGQDSLGKGVMAALLGLGLVAAYLAAFYRGFGVASWFSLSVFATLFLGVLSLLSNFGWFALSLPGIAGIVLTIGLAADSEILMIERFKEEVRDGKTYRSAAKHGTRHAIGTSLDADLVTFVSALMLYTFAIGPVRGFALTLMIGLVIDIFMMVFWSRSVIIFLAESVVPKAPWLFGVKGGEVDAKA